MKVLTLNTHSWLEDDQEAKLKVIAQEIAAGDYDSGSRLLLVMDLQSCGL